MPRDHAQVFHRIWSDPEFLARPAASQRVFLMLLSQPSMNYAGVLDLTAGRWARYAPDTAADGIRAALADLEEHRFVVVDHDTEEVLVRTFIRNDRLWKNVRLLRVAIREALATQSSVLRQALADELARLPRVVIPDPRAPGRSSAEARAKAAEEAQAAQQELDDAVTELCSGPGSMPRLPLESAPAAAPAAAPGAAPAPPPGPPPGAAPGPPPSPGGTRVHAHARVGDGDGDGVGDGSVVTPAATSKNDLGGIVTEVDARDVEPPAVPDTRPPPDDQPGDDHTEPRRSAPTPARPGSAMPPRRCPKHLEFTDAKAEKCGHCKDARLAQEAWIADRDAKVAAARAEVEAERAAESTAARQAIAGCPLCDDRGVTPAGVRCTHTEESADRYSTGRAQFRAEKAKLDQRLEAKRAPRPAGVQMASQPQRSAITTILDKRGVKSRPAILTLLSEATGRQITSRSELTSAEASSILDRLTGPPLVDTPPDEPDPGDVDLSDPEAVAAAAPHERGVCPDCAADDHCRSCDCCDQDDPPGNDDQGGRPCGRCFHDHDAECDAPVADDEDGDPVVVPCGCPSWVEPEDDTPAVGYRCDVLGQHADCDLATCHCGCHEDADDDADDGTEPGEPDGDDAFEDEYRRDQETWAAGEPDDQAGAYSYAGSPDDPPF